MILLTPEQTNKLKSWILPEQPGPMIGSHVVQTGHGICYADRWPEPRVILVETAGNYALLGDPEVLNPADLQPLIKGFVATSKLFLPILKVAFPDLVIWQRVILTEQDSPSPIVDRKHEIRRLIPSDLHHLRGLSADSDWISKTWGGPKGLANSGYGWGAFIADQLVSVACTFFLGSSFEDIGVVTEPGFRGLGLSTTCAQALCGDIRARGHRASWTTSPDNLASLRIAERLGFRVERHDVLYVVGISAPKPAT
jgi:RimJ/RimL family protein N-acetyltransferase